MGFWVVAMVQAIIKKQDQYVPMGKQVRAKRSL
jgi:hypothetical protein